MDLPEHWTRHPTAAAIASLARRFDLPNEVGMQDWEWEVADPGRISEFLAAYESGELDEDERFTLMEILLQSFEERADSTEPWEDGCWQRVLHHLDANIELHIHSVQYWAMPDEEDPAHVWQVTPALREILARHRARFEVR